jgi:TetR/AcrR family transcriptional repressor of bet genes
MPLPTDHEDRRRALSLIAAERIAATGLDSVTIRGLAAIAGCSTTIVTHYFANKRALLQRTYTDAALRAQARVDGALSRDPADIEGCLEALLPLDDEGLRDWKVYLAFWQTASADPDFAEEQRRWLANARSLIRGALAAAGATDMDAEARRLLTLVQGIAVQAVFDEKDWSPEIQRQFVRLNLRRS